MGANNSRFHGSGGEVFPAIIRPGIEELRKQKSRERSTQSDKQLLNYDGAADERKFQSSEENESEHNDTQQAKHVERLSKVAPLPVSQEQRHELHNEEKWGEVVELRTEKVKGAGVQQNIKYEEEAFAKHGSDDEDEDDNESERAIGPSSPSFKIYCSEASNENEGALPESKALDAGDKNQTVALFQESPSADRVECSAPALGNTGNSNEMVKVKTVSSKRKGKKRKKFGPMKMNLLPVKHLHMNRMIACTGNDRRIFLQRSDS